MPASAAAWCLSASTALRNQDPRGAPLGPPLPCIAFFCLCPCLVFVLLFVEPVCPRCAAAVHPFPAGARLSVVPRLPCACPGSGCWAPARLARCPGGWGWQRALTGAAAGPSRRALICCTFALHSSPLQFPREEQPSYPFTHHTPAFLQPTPSPSEGSLAALRRVARHLGCLPYALPLSLLARLLASKTIPVPLDGAL